MVAAFLIFFIRVATHHVPGLMFQVDIITRPVQFQFYIATQAEFVICEQTISTPHT